MINYFNDMSKLFNKLKLPLIWKTPSGIIIKQKYNKFESHRVRGGLYKGRDYTIKFPTNIIDIKQQVHGFMPNLIHSLDASVLHLLLKKLSTNYTNQFFSIHDCFATTANNINTLNIIIRECLLFILIIIMLMNYIIHFKMKLKKYMKLMIILFM